MNGRGGSTSIPPGWDRWFELPGSSTHSSTGYVVNDQGKNVSYPNSKNDSQLAYEKALPWIKSRTPATRPFFIQYSPTNPHTPYTPTAVHAHLYDDEPPRDVPSINEANVLDKPAKMRKGLVSVATMENAEEGMREELEDTDDFIAGLIEAAEAVTGNSNLLVIFTSDNGFQAGEHRLMNKSWQYQESVEIPLIMRGTGLPARQEPTQLVSSVDIAGTILNFAGASPLRTFDGRSLHEIVLGIQPADAPWRKRVLIENPVDRKWQMYREFQPAAGKDFAFIRHLDDPTPEYYDLTKDPYQLDSTPSMVTQDMRSKLDRLTSLTGGNLRAVEEEPSTTPGGDTTLPKVISTVPTAGATGVAPSSNLTATFSEKMDPASITTSTFKLFKVNADGTQTQITNVSVSLSTDGLKATLNPFGTSTTLLSTNTKYKAVITTGARDVAGNQLDQNTTTAGLQQKAWTFTVSL
jgi:arylsulfatase A-like enzyme